MEGWKGGDGGRMKGGRNKKGRYERRMWVERWPGVLVDVGEGGGGGGTWV